MYISLQSDSCILYLSKGNLAFTLFVHIERLKISCSAYEIQTLQTGRTEPSFLEHMLSWGRKGGGPKTIILEHRMKVDHLIPNDYELAKHLLKTHTKMVVIISGHFLNCQEITALTHLFLLPLGSGNPCTSST